MGDFLEASVSVLALLGAGILAARAVAAFVSSAAVYRQRGATEAYTDLRGRLSRAALAGLDILIAADAIRSIAISPTLMAVVALGILILTRALLGWTIEIEAAGEWPRQRAR